MSLMDAYMSPPALPSRSRSLGGTYLWLTPTYEILTLLRHHQRCTSTWRCPVMTTDYTLRNTCFSVITYPQPAALPSTTIAINQPFSPTGGVILHIFLMPARGLISEGWGSVVTNPAALKL